MGVSRAGDDAPSLGMSDAERAMAKAQLAVVERCARAADGAVIHPRLLDQYTRRVSLADAFDGTQAGRTRAIADHFDLIIAAVGTGRDELVRLHRAHQIDDETLHSLERDLDLAEPSAISAKA